VPAELDDVVRAGRFVYLNKCGFNGLYRVNRAGRFNVPFGKHYPPPTLYDLSNLRAVSRALEHVELMVGDFERVMDRAIEGDFVYVDPPYVPLTATASFTRYTSVDFGPDDQIRLANAVRRAASKGVFVLVSNSDTEMTRSLYADFRIHMVKANRLINSDPAGRSKITELAIQAYPGER
jgi:DNA adenine methylase